MHQHLWLLLSAPHSGCNQLREEEREREKVKVKKKGANGKLGEKGGGTGGRAGKEKGTVIYRE